ncbi:MAG TPA: hypothetical protein PLU30_20910 [Verrucomicrobiae bacterium]|nr:hypothetical protein [Verrucomicrobiae bacterium]
MEHFPFEQIIGLIVFVIIALAQFWTKLRTGKPMPQPEEPEPEFDFPDFGDPKPLAPPQPAPARATPSRAPTPRLDEALREALGLPTATRPSSAAPPLQQKTPASPPVLTQAAAIPQPAQQQRSPKIPAAPTPPLPAPSPGYEARKPADVLTSIERLEQETDFVRARLQEIGRMDVSAGRDAEARMRRRLGELVQELGLARTATAPPAARKEPLIRRWLSDRNALRRAIVLNEVLGPPRSLNPHS